MADAFSEFVATLKEKVNIVDVVAGYVSLEKRGANYWACCPFHHEKTPSFSINEPDQFYHCFGCGESGDVIKFVKEMENIDFMDAVKLLAERVKLPLPQTNYDSQKTVEQKRKRDTVLKILNDTAHFYLDNLNSGKADEHIEYILKRQIPSNIVRTFGLGASLNFNDLPAFLLKKGYDKQDLLDSGVINSVDGRLIDSQGGRLIFPIINAMGEVIAFGGRALKKVDFGKYKNTKDTVVFSKSKSLYNINLLKKLKTTQNIKEVIMVEGYMDTISLYQSGFKNVVASMGTSLTHDQARLIKRYTDTVLISYDGDSAGQNANLRGLEILKHEGLNVKVVPLVDNLDPDDVIKQLGAEGYQSCLDRAMPLIDFKLHSLKAQYDITKSEEKRKFVSEALKVIKTADSAAEQEDLLKALRDISGITYESLKRDLTNAPAEVRTEEKPAPQRKDNSSVADRASRFVISAYLFGAKFTDDLPITEVEFNNDVHSIISRYIQSKRLMEERVQPAELFEFFEEDSEDYAELCRILDYSDGDRFKGEVAEKYFYDCVKKLKTDSIDSRIASLKSKIDGESDAEKRKQMAQTIQKLTQTKRKINSGDK
ncbi:MAG: DNA primase [Clostridiales bacterium]|nr:DNA primase [Clostridiales bacterium]